MVCQTYRNLKVNFKRDTIVFMKAVPLSLPYSTCGVCGVPLHYMPAKGKHEGMTCFFDYHSDIFFGLACDDTKVNKTKKYEWVYPTVAKKKKMPKKL